MGLQATARNIDFKDVLSFELAALPTSLFNDTGTMRVCSSKAELKNKTCVEISSRNVPQTNCIILDGCAILRIIPWSASSQTKEALVSDYVSAFKVYLKRKLEHWDVYLVFDKYNDFSTKSSARSERTSSQRLYPLTLSSPLPSQSSILSVAQNKKQLIVIFIDSLAGDRVFSQDLGRKLIVTGQTPTPIEISADGLVIFRQDLENFHEEADAIIVAQAIYAATVEFKHVQVVADDTDIYIMLLYHYFSNSLESTMILTPTRHGRCVIDIKASVGNMCLEICSCFGRMCSGSYASWYRQTCHAKNIETAQVSS